MFFSFVMCLNQAGCCSSVCLPCNTDTVCGCSQHPVQLITSLVFILYSMDFSYYIQYNQINTKQIFLLLHVWKWSCMCKHQSAVGQWKCLLSLLGNLKSFLLLSASFFGTVYKEKAYSQGQLWIFKHFQHEQAFFSPQVEPYLTNPHLSIFFHWRLMHTCSI